MYVYTNTVNKKTCVLQPYCYVNKRVFRYASVNKYSNSIRKKYFIMHMYLFTRNFFLAAKYD
jgi:hypothetical protein